MKRKIIYISFIASFAIINSSFSQSSDTLFYKNEIGFNVSGLLGGIFNNANTYSYGHLESTPPIQILYKRQIKSNSSLRLGLNTSFQNSDRITESNDSLQDNKLNKWHYFNLLIGKEWQNHITAKWTFFGGADLGPFFSKSQTNSETKNKNTNEILGKDEWNNYSYGGILRPFIGIRFNLHKRLYLATEASLSLRFSKNTGKNKTTSSDKIESKSVNSTNALALGMESATGIFLFYKF